MLGQPHPHTLEELIRECQKCKDSLDDFEAWNSGINITNSSKELDFVVEPFETPQGWQDQDPDDWKPKHEYGGKRIPIRLEVFMHVTQLKKLDALQAQISRDFDALSTDLETPEKMSWLNQDSNYKQSICEVIDFKHVRMSKLVRELSALDKATLRMHSPRTCTWLPGRDEPRLLPRSCPSVPTLMPKTRRGTRASTSPPPKEAMRSCACS